MKFSDVTLCIPTRGDIDLAPILSRLPDFHDVIVWDNSVRRDFGIYARYVAGWLAETSVIATQDDDLVVTCWDQILAAYQPGRLTVNYPEPWDIPWVARGAIFDQSLPFKSFLPYWQNYPFDEFFTHHACDGIFSLLAADVEVIDGGSEDLPQGFATGRVSTSPGWYDDKRPELQRRCEGLLAAC